MPIKFHGCQVIREKRETFLPWIKSDIWYCVSFCFHSNNTSSFKPIGNCHTCLQGYKYKLLMPMIKELSACIYLLYSGNTLYMKPCELLWHCIVGCNSNTFGSKSYPPIMCITFPGYIPFKCIPVFSFSLISPHKMVRIYPHVHQKSLLKVILTLHD